MNQGSKLETILLVEDDIVDVMTTQRAFKELGILEALHVVGNGEEGLEFLNDPENPTPNLILLDINMPRMNGLEFLKEAKSSDPTRRIPVVILTTSKEDQDRLDSFNLGVAGYIVKPVNYQKYLSVIEKVTAYWNASESPDFS